jgi:UDP-3-O-[3-hydroxymyristoyl] glucosamine N-acyltransferase
MCLQKAYKGRVMEKRFIFKTKDLLKFEEFKSINLKEIILYNVSTLENPQNNTILFASKKKWNNSYADNLCIIKDCLIILETEIKIKDIVLEKNIVLPVANARLEFAKLLIYIMSYNNINKKYSYSDGNIAIGEDVKIGLNTIIEPFVLIGHNVVIGDNCILKTGVKIRNNVTIGNNVIIGENSVIGDQGLGVETDSDGRSYRIPHIGGVRIGNFVEIGALSTIVSGTIEPTIIEDFVFIDDLNHIAHNCKIGKSTITAGLVEISGSAEVGENCFLAPMACVRNGKKIGNHCFIGQMTSVIKDIRERSTIAGNPGEDLNIQKKWRMIQKKLIDNEK